MTDKPGITVTPDQAYRMRCALVFAADDAKAKGDHLQAARCYDGVLALMSNDGYSAAGLRCYARLQAEAWLAHWTAKGDAEGIADAQRKIDALL